MDPNATLEALFSAVSAGDPGEAAGLSAALSDWLLRGGFPPEALAAAGLGDRDWLVRQFAGAAVVLELARKWADGK